MASTYLTRTFSSSGTSDKIWTWSSWIKRSEVTGEAAILTAGSSARDFIRFEASTTIGALRVRFSNGSADVTTNRRFRDTSGWYHLVVAVDTTQATASNRIKIYINGVQETSFSSSSYPSQNYVTKIGGGYVHNIGNDSEQTVPYFDGSMSHVHFIDGTAYDASAFGEYDANGVWKIKTDVSVTYGTNGFFILKDGNSVTDQSGEGNNFTVGGGTLTNTEDNPSNVFATLNPLDIGYTSNLTLANGNNTTNQTSNWGDYGIRSTLAATTGKYYWEAKIATSNTLCILPMETRLVINLSDGSPAGDLYGVQRYSDSTTNIYDDGTFTQNSSTMWGGITSSDIISFALDLDNGKLFLAKNGAYKNQSGATGDPVNGTNPTFTISDTTKTYGFYTEMRGNDNNGTIMNFGNGYFGTTAVSSAGTNASGIGIFEYDVPTGYTALSTKGLNL